MKAAVVYSFGSAPRYAEIAAPLPAGADDMVIDVIAAGLHPRVRSQADGSHYTSTGVLPLVPGIDGVGRGADGLLRYFIVPDAGAGVGAMAEQTVIDARRSIVLPEDSDPIAVAAAMNPAMSSWLALRQRVQFRTERARPRCTGNAGRMAVQIARLFGANQIIAAGRDADRLASLPGLGATNTVLLEGDSDTVGRRLGRVRSRRRDRLPVGRTHNGRDDRRRHRPRRQWQAAHMD